MLICCQGDLAVMDCTTWVPKGHPISHDRPVDSNKLAVIAHDMLRAPVTGMVPCRLACPSHGKVPGLDGVVPVDGLVGCLVRDLEGNAMDAMPVKKSVNNECLDDSFRIEVISDR